MATKKRALKDPTVGLIASDSVVLLVGNDAFGPFTPSELATFEPQIQRWAKRCGVEVEMIPLMSPPSSAAETAA